MVPHCNSRSCDPAALNYRVHFETTSSKKSSNCQQGRHNYHQAARKIEFKRGHMVDTFVHRTKEELTFKE